MTRSPQAHVTIAISKQAVQPMDKKIAPGVGAQCTTPDCRVVGQLFSPAAFGQRRSIKVHADRRGRRRNREDP